MPAASCRFPAAAFRFAGSIDPDGFSAFVRDRAARLDLSGWMRREGAAIRCVVSGPPDLIDAFEMACLVGPAGALVTEAGRSPAEPPAAAGFVSLPEERR